MELTLLAAAATGGAAVWLTNHLLRGRITLDRPTDALIGAAAVGLFSGRIAAMVSTGVNPLTSPGDLLVVRGGVDTTVASLAAVATLAWAHRSALPTALDQLAPAALAGLAGWHLGCVWRGACLGTTSDLPWAMASPGSDIGRHPVELYTAVAMALSAVWVSRLTERPWVATGGAVAAAGLARLATQPLRVSVTGGPVAAYAAATLVGVVLAVWGQSRIRTRPPGPSSIEI